MPTELPVVQAGMPVPLAPDVIKELSAEIRQLAAEKNAVILAHNYELPEVQDVADYIGDSLGLSRQAAAADADVLFRDRFNCADLDLNRGPMNVENEDPPKLNYVEVVKGTANRRTAECGHSGSGLALRPNNGSRYITNPDQSSCEFALVIADDFSGKGLGSRLMLSIMDVAREKGLTEIVGLVLTNNPGMLKLMKSLGYSIKAYPDDPDFRLVTHPL